MPVNTFRAWFIGFIWSIILPGLNQFFFFRYPSVTVTYVRPPFTRSYLLRSAGLLIAIADLLACLSFRLPPSCSPSPSVACGLG